MLDLTVVGAGFRIEGLWLSKTGLLGANSGLWILSGLGVATMKKAEMKAYKELLLALRARLRGDVNAMADAALRKTRSEANGDLRACRFTWPTSAATTTSRNSR